MSTSSWPSTGKRTDAPVDRPIQLRCINLIESDQSRSSRSSSSRSAYDVMRIIHCLSGRRYTGKLPRSLRPSPVTSSFASTVPKPGHQFTGAYAVVREPVRVDELTLLRDTEIVERNVVGGREATGTELADQLLDRTGPALVLVVPRVVDLQEDPLRPPVVRDVGGRRRRGADRGRARARASGASSWRCSARWSRADACRSAPRTARPAGRTRRNPSRATRC